MLEELCLCNQLCEVLRHQHFFHLLFVVMRALSNELLPDLRFLKLHQMIGAIQRSQLDRYQLIGPPSGLGP